MTFMRYRKNGFTMVELVVALSLFALIALPAVGIMSMTTRKAYRQSESSDAVYLKRYLDQEVIDGEDLAFEPGWPGSNGVILHVSQDLQRSGFSDDAGLDDSDRYYEVAIRSPEGGEYVVGDASQMLVYIISWPAFIEDGQGNFVANAGPQEALTLTTVLLK